MQPLPDLIGSYQAKKVPFRRRLTMESLDALPRGHTMLALLELDVTDLLALVQVERASGVQISLFAGIAGCVAQALAEHPELNAMRVGQRIYQFEDVDLNIPVELRAGSEVAPHLLIVRRAQHKSAGQIYREIAQARHQASTVPSVGREDRRVQLLMRLLLWVPRAVRSWVIRRLAGRGRAIKKLAGTTFLSSVEKSSSLRGFAVPYVAGPVATSFFVGSVVPKPMVHEGKVAVRTCLSLTIAFNHDVVDGSPAARFATRLSELIEHPALSVALAAPSREARVQANG